MSMVITIGLFALANVFFARAFYIMGYNKGLSRGMMSRDTLSYLKILSEAANNLGKTEEEESQPLLFNLVKNTTPIIAGTKNIQEVYYDYIDLFRSIDSHGGFDRYWRSWWCFYTTFGPDLGNLDYLVVRGTDQTNQKERKN